MTSGGMGVKADPLQPIISWRVRTVRGYIMNAAVSVHQTLGDKTGY